MSSSLFDGANSGIGRFAGFRARGTESTTRTGIRYPNPFFDVASTYLPATMKLLLRWCRHYYMVNPLINSVVHKMSEYPITDLVFDEQDPKAKGRWEETLHEMKFRAFQVEVGLDYFTYGMCVVTAHFPFNKYLVCRMCPWEELAEKVPYRWLNLDYIVTCPKCGYTGPAKVKDWYYRDVRKIRLLRWNPENIHVEQQSAGADPKYTFEMPALLKNDVILGKRVTVNTIPDTYLEALKRNKYISFTPDNVFVFKRPIISQKDNGWGMPLVLPVMKDVFYLQILRKAQEMIAQDHIVPMRILFPQASGATSDPYSNIDLNHWKVRIESEVAKWKFDQNYMPVMPIPLGSETIGGDAKALMLYQEIELTSKQVVAGMGVPYEFVFGGLSYSGSNVSLRMLENHFLGYRIDQDRLIDFVIKRIAYFMGWKPTKARMRRFKMADDLQRLGLYFQFNQAQKMSDETLQLEADLDPVLEKTRRERELNTQLAFNRKMQLNQAGIAGEASLVQARWAVQAQLLQQQMMPQPQPGQDPNAQAGAQPQPGQEQQQGQPATTGQEGEMQQGPQVNPSMPQNSTVSAENAQGAPRDGVPGTAVNPMTSGSVMMGQNGGSYNILYLARRAATALMKLDPSARYSELERMRMTEPRLYAQVIQMLQKGQGSQANPLDPVQSPIPEQKPSRRAAPVGA